VDERHTLMILWNYASALSVSINGSSRNTPLLTRVTIDDANAREDNREQCKPKSASSPLSVTGQEFFYGQPHRREPTK
jgi:hypothetical protein